MTPESIAARRIRLSSSEGPALAPFVRADTITVVSVYFLVVREFPVPFRQRQWILTFLERLSSVLIKRGLLEETLLQLKHTRQELNKRFTQTLLEYEPVMGVLVEPGKGLPVAPTSLEIKKLVEAPDSNAEIKIEHLAPDYCVWFLQKKAEAQRRDFFGVGGMMLLWVDATEGAPMPQFKFPRALTSDPAFAKHDFQGQLLKLQSMQAPWLKKSKEVFGEPIKDEAMFQGVPFVLPKLDAAAFTSASQEQLAEWFGIVPVLFLESEKDGGLLLAVGEPDFDGEVQAIVDGMLAEDLEFPL